MAPTRKKTRGPSGLPPYLASLYEVPLLTREQEYHLFRKFNYLKFKAVKLRDKLDPAHARTTVMDEIEKLYDEAVKMKNEIVQANLRLVVSIAKRHVTRTEDFFGLVSDGNMSLIRAAEKFDLLPRQQVQHVRQLGDHEELSPARFPDEYKHRDRFRTSQDEMFTGKQDNRGDELGEENAQRSSRTAGRADSRPPGRARAADHRQPLRPRSQPRAADAEGSRQRDGRDQRADSPDRIPRSRQGPPGRPRRPRRGAGLSVSGAGFLTCLVLLPLPLRERAGVRGCPEH